MFPGDAPKGPEPHWLRRQEQGSEGSLGAGRTFTLRMVSVSVSLPCAHLIAVVSAHCKKYHPSLPSSVKSRSTPKAERSGSPSASPVPRWIPPQLCQLVETAPSGPQWLHEIELDGFRMSARIERRRVQLLTRTELDWSHS